MCNVNTVSHGSFKQKKGRKGYDMYLHACCRLQKAPLPGKLNLSHTLGLGPLPTPSLLLLKLQQKRMQATASPTHMMPPLPGMF